MYYLKRESEDEKAKVKEEAIKELGR